MNGWEVSSVWDGQSIFVVSYIIHPDCMSQSGRCGIQIIIDRLSYVANLTLIEQVDSSVISHPESTPGGWSNSLGILRSLSMFKHRECKGCIEVSSLCHQPY